MTDSEKLAMIAAAHRNLKAALAVVDSLPAAAMLAAAFGDEVGRWLRA